MKLKGGLGLTFGLGQGSRVRLTLGPVLAVVLPLSSSMVAEPVDEASEMPLVGMPGPPYCQSSVQLHLSPSAPSLKQCGSKQYPQKDPPRVRPQSVSSQIMLSS